MESPNLKEAIKSRICSDISEECKRLCSTANPSLLRGMTKEAMVNFSWQAVERELQTKAPLFLRCILAAADQANGTATIYDPVRHPGVHTAAAILLKKRDKAISLIPYVISTILKVGKTSKTVRSKTKPVIIQFWPILYFVNMLQSAVRIAETDRVFVIKLLLTYVSLTNRGDILLCNLFPSFAMFLFREFSHNHG